jgi:hypothetical protein
MSLAERLAVIAAARTADLEASASAELPLTGAMFHPKDWPLDARVWFYKAGIGNPDINTLGAFWSPAMRRVVLPYRTVTGERAWIARDPSWTKGKPMPKYLFPAGVARGGGALFSNGYEKPVGIVVVEDALSAYRIQRDTDYDAVAAQGTTLDRDAIVAIAEMDVPVVVWLDPDSWGQIGAGKLLRAFANLDVPVRNIESLRDPKNHEPHEIQEALEV